MDRDPEVLLEAKRLGFSDKQVANAVEIDEDDVRAMRERMGITPKVKAIDTLAAEWPARTNYLYVTYNASTDDAKPTDRRKVIVLGAGPYRIGSSVEFDWGTMNMAWALKESGKVDEVIVVNCNPETVSTDFDMSDRLYFEELTAERVLSIYEREKPIGAVLCVGGQIPERPRRRARQEGRQRHGDERRLHREGGGQGEVRVPPGQDRHPPARVGELQVHEAGAAVLRQGRLSRSSSGRRTS